MNDSRNSYMDEVMQQQADVVQELKKSARPANQMMQMRQRRVGGPPAPQAQQQAPGGGGGGGGGGGTVSGNGVDVRVTGIWRFQTVLVPPNAWVVHTRRGHTEPLHLGLGVSFSFDPYRDSFLVAPATMQTLAINAKCICSERQGILVQAYVQWIVDDFKAAYQKLDFSDVDDPMRIVNVQLREQAEASIKDKVASMSIDEILADKRPIIDELTARLRGVAEGQGLKIVQVQIKEAVVSSTTVWENLQKPFREEKARLARIAELDRERAIQQREVLDSNDAERARIAADNETERMRRAQEVELAKSRGELEETRVTAELLQIEAQLRLDVARADADLAAVDKALAKKQREHEAAVARDRTTLGLEIERRKMDNDVSVARLDELLVRSLPQVAASLPRATKSEVVTISGDGGNDGVLAVAGLVKGLRALLAKPE
ncbi:MAG: SPFH domain-containing protein [Deltaproteobacteria bacterium]|nr:SPFH domain-containing protein [Deltaproteobacteria bacterium]